jgi:type IV pilus assembly protein PilZ
LLRARARLGYDPEERRMVPDRANNHDDTSGVFVHVEVDSRDQENFLFAYIHDLNATGIFVRTTSPERPGTNLYVRFKAVDASPGLELDGQVIWINPYRPDDSNNLSPGMGIRFLDLTREQRAQLVSLIKRFAYLYDDAQTR